jgi:hypothetical protein
MAVPTGEKTLLWGCHMLSAQRRFPLLIDANESPVYSNFIHITYARIKQWNRLCVKDTIQTWCEADFLCISVDWVFLSETVVSQKNYFKSSNEQRIIMMMVLWVWKAIFHKNMLPSYSGWDKDICIVVFRIAETYNILAWMNISEKYVTQKTEGASLPKD